MPGRRRKHQTNIRFSSPFNFFNPHDGEAPYFNGRSVIIASIDPGILNCAIYVAKRKEKTKKKESIYLSRKDFSQESSHYTNSIKILEKLEQDHKLFSNCQYIVIEEQMTMSIKNTRMGQHLITFFCTMLRNKGNKPIIIEITSQAKTKVLQCPVRKKTEYKKWCKNKAIELLENRDDPKEDKFITCIEIAKKGDDLGDSVAQLEALFELLDSGIYDYPKPIKREKDEKQDD